MRTCCFYIKQQKVVEKYSRISNESFDRAAAARVKNA